MNLRHLLQCDKTTMRSSLESKLAIVLCQTKLFEEKDRLQKLCQKKVERLLRKKIEEPKKK